MIQTNTNGQLLLMVKVKKRDHDFSITHIEIPVLLWFNNAGFLCGKHLPPGEWEIVGKGDAIGEEVAASILGEVIETDPRGYRVPRRESLKWVIRSHNMKPETTVILKEKK